MVAPKQYFMPYRWQDIVMPKTLKNDLDDIPKLGLAGTRSARNSIGQFSDNQKRMWTAYYAAVAFMDEQVGRMLDELERLGLRDSTAVVFLSDHGYHLGEHTFWQKNNLHEEVTRVPLIISAPGYKPSRTNSIVELVDLFPTLSELAGLTVPNGLHGKSLVPILKDQSATVKEGALSFAKGNSWRTDRWAYMRYNDQSEELYDMKTDPAQFTNLAKDQDSTNVLKRMAVGLDARLKSVGITR
jgi:iduronate 2-sulfatase